MDQDAKTEVGLGPDDIVLDQDQAPLPKMGAKPLPQFSAQTAGWIKMALGAEVGLAPGHIVLDGDPAPLPKKGGRVIPIFGPFLLWPNGWMHQDATWCGGRPQRRRLCVRWGPSAPTPQKGRSPPIFGPRILWPNGCMDQDATCYEGMPRFTRHCVRLGPSSTSHTGVQPQFSANVRYGQTAGWTTMPPGREV